MASEESQLHCFHRDSMEEHIRLWPPASVAVWPYVLKKQLQETPVLASEIQASMASAMIPRSIEASAHRTQCAPDDLTT